MDSVLNIEVIKQTKAFKSLSPIQQTFVQKRVCRQQITDCLIVIRNGGPLNNSIGKSSISIVLELYKEAEGVEYKPN
jgi:hypothetical protein